MKKQSKLLIIGALLLAIVGGGYYAYLLQSEPEQAAQGEQSDPTPDESAAPVVNRPSTAETTVTGSYIDYQSQDAVTRTDGTKVLFFHAPWCPQCRQLDSELSAAEIPDGVTVFKTDYDSNQDLRAKYGVTLQTTFVAVDDQGELVEKYVAYDEPTFDTLNREFISKL